MFATYLVNVKGVYIWKGGLEHENGCQKDDKKRPKRERELFGKEEIQV